MRFARRTGLIATSLAVAAIAAPAASAGQGGQSSNISPWAGPLAFQQSQTPASTPEPLAGPLAFQPGTSGSVKVPPTIVRVPAPSAGFDYADAAVGAGVIAGLTLLGAAGTLTVRRRGQLRHS
jgi:hypothetical protein